MQGSGPLQRKLDMYRECQQIPLTGFANYSAPVGPHLQPLQGLVYADNHQMQMFRDGLFMNSVATAPFYEGETQLQLDTWGLFQVSVR